MKTACKPFLMGLIGLLALLPMTKAFCQSAPEPAIVVSIASIDEQIADTNYMIDAAGYGSMKFFIKTQMKHFTSGLDRKKAAGVLLYFEEDNPVPKAVGFAPLKNLDDFLDTVAGYADVDDADEVITVTPQGGQNVLMKQVGDYIYIADNEDAFKGVPNDPAALLGDLPTQYNMAARIFGQRVPESLREQLMDSIKDGYLSQMDRLADENPELAEQQRESFEEQMDKMEGYLDETEEIVVGFSADKATQTLAMDFKMIALPSTELAGNFNAMTDGEKSRFGGFLRDGAAMNSNACFKVLEAEAAQYAKGMETGLEGMIKELDADGDFSESEIETIESVANKIVEALSETFKAGRIDSGSVMMMSENSANLAGAIEIVNPRKIEDAVKELVELGEAKLGEALQVNLNSGSHNGVTFHELVLQVPEDEEEMQEYLGSEVTVIVGIGKKEVYFAAGTDPMDTLKTAMDSSSDGKELAPVVYNFNLKPMMRYASSVNGEPIFGDMFEQLEESGKDRITMIVKGIKNGVHSRFEMQDGVLGLIQTAVNSFQSGGFAPDDF